MPEPAPPRWVADEMLGRLARYLRFLGHDTLYIRGLSDREISERARCEGRVLLTRDRELARRTDGAVLLRSVAIGAQLREVRAAFPSEPYEPRFNRCAECNELLHPWSYTSGDPWPPEVPRPSTPGDLPIFECPGCRRHYWEGSHARHIRTLLESWWAEEPA